MPIEARLTIPQTTLLVQQSPACTLVVTNNGSSEVLFPPSFIHPAVVGMKITDVKTGIEVLRWREPGLVLPQQRPAALEIIGNGGKISPNF